MPKTSLPPKMSIQEVAALGGRSARGDKKRQSPQHYKKLRRINLLKWMALLKAGKIDKFTCKHSSLPLAREIAKEIGITLTHSVKFRGRLIIEKT